MDRKDRINEAINYLIGEGKISNKSTQKDIAGKMQANYTNVNYAINGSEEYLTDRFLRRFNAAFGDIFSEDWLLNGNGEKLKSSQKIGDVVNSTIVGANVNGNGIRITHNDLSEMIELQKGYQELLKKKDDHISELLLIVSKLANNGK
jgi:hypothetical protein